MVLKIVRMDLINFKGEIDATFIEGMGCSGGCISPERLTPLKKEQKW